MKFYDRWKDFFFGFSFWRHIRRGCVLVRIAMSHGTTSPYISLSLIAEAIEAIEVIEAIEAIGAIEAIWGNGDHAASIASIAPAIEAIGAI